MQFDPVLSEFDTIVSDKGCRRLSQTVSMSAAVNNGVSPGIVMLAVTPDCRRCAIPCATASDCPLSEPIRMG